jgi:Raf kinase inhibitor-like YbhB/YbcL family protein
MRSVNSMRVQERTRALAVVATIALSSAGVAGAADGNSAPRLQVSSRTFQNGGTLPDRMANTILNSSGVNICTLDGKKGGDESPQLSWSNAPPETASFVIVMYDETAGFTHWGVYDISSDVHSLPANLALDSGIGIQVFNDNFTQGYTGPCPPTGVPPTRHRYTVTVYALSDKLEVVNLPNFPAFGESIYQALIKAARRGQILQSSTIEGFASTTPKK